MIGKIEANNVNFWYGDFHALKGISMSIDCLLYTSPSPRDTR